MCESEFSLWAHTHTLQGLMWFRLHTRFLSRREGPLSTEALGCSKRFSVTNSRVRKSGEVVSRKVMGAHKPRALCTARSTFSQKQCWSWSDPVQHHIHREAVSFRSSKSKSLETALLDAQEALNGTQHQRQIVQAVSRLYKVRLHLET